MLYYSCLFTLALGSVMISSYASFAHKNYFRTIPVNSITIESGSSSDSSSGEYTIDDSQKEPSYSDELKFKVVCKPPPKKLKGILKKSENSNSKDKDLQKHTKSKESSLTKSEILNKTKNGRTKDLKRDTKTKRLTLSRSGISGQSDNSSQSQDLQKKVTFSKDVSTRNINGTITKSQLNDVLPFQFEQKVRRQRGNFLQNMIAAIQGELKELENKMRGLKKLMLQYSQTLNLVIQTLKSPIRFTINQLKPKIKPKYILERISELMQESVAIDKKRELYIRALADYKWQLEL